MSWMALVAAAVLCGLSIFYGFRGETFMGRPLGGDFVAFYVTGRILNEFQPSQIYDLDLEVKLQHVRGGGGVEDSRCSRLRMLPILGRSIAHLRCCLTSGLTSRG